MSIPELKAGMKVLISDTTGRSSSYFGKTAILKTKYDHGGPDGWLIDIDNGDYWWGMKNLKVLCCGAKGCLWHRKNK